MSSAKIKTIVEIIISIVGLLGTLGVSLTANGTIKVVVGVGVGILLAVMIFWGIRTLLKLRNQEKLSSNAGIMKKANAVCKELYTLLNGNAKMLKKFNRLEERKLDKDKTDQVLNRIIYGKQEKSLEQLINEQEQLKSSFIETILGMDRILLISEQYNYRIRFGQYIVNNCDDPDNIIKAYVDFIGWTYVILGKTVQAEKYINKGIEVIDREMNAVGISNEEKQKLLMKKIRALRHLGSNYNEYTKRPQRCLEQLNKAAALMQDKDFKAYYANDPKYEEMDTGIQYGIAICDLYIYKKQKNSATNRDKLLSTLKESCDLTLKYLPKAQTFSNKHRYVKYLLLANNLSYEIWQLDEQTRSRYDLCATQSAPGVTKAPEHYKHNIACVEKELNNSMFSDEALIYYLMQKEVLVDRDTKKILENAQIPEGA